MGNAFLDQLARYRDRYGFPSGSLSPHDPSGNCLMFLSEEMLILKDQELLTFQDRARFASLVALCQLMPGNYARTPSGCPFRTVQEQQDDFIGLAAASAAIQSEHAFQIHMFGRITRFRWKIFRFRFAFPTLPMIPTGETQDVNAWLGRNPSFVAHLTWARGLRPNWFYRLAWCWAVAFAGWANPSAQDPWRLSYLLSRTAPTGSKFAPEYWAVLLWSWRLHRTWPGGMPQVRKAYFGDPVHPLATWMREASNG